MTRERLDKLIALDIITEYGSGLYNQLTNRYLVGVFLKHSPETYDIYVYSPVATYPHEDYLLIESTINDHAEAIEHGLEQWRLLYCTT